MFVLKLWTVVGYLNPESRVQHKTKAMRNRHIQEVHHNSNVKAQLLVCYKTTPAIAADHRILQFLIHSLFVKGLVHETFMCVCVGAVCFTTEHWEKPGTILVDSFRP